MKRCERLIQQTAEQTGVDQKKTNLYIRAFFDSVCKSVGKGEPVHVRDRLSIRIHKYLFKKYTKGERLPMPEGITEKLEVRKTYNTSRKAGTFVKVDDRIGVVIEQVGDDDILFKQLVSFTRRGGKVVWKKDVGGEELLTPDQYPSKASVRQWLKMIELYPVMTDKGFINTLKQLRREHLGY